MTSSRWVGVILAAGSGSRMRSSFPKPLHRVCGRTLLEHALRIVRETGVERTIVVASPLLAADPQLLSLIGEGTTVAVQAEPRGTGDALLAASDAAEGAAHLLVANADMPLVLPATVRSMLERHLASGAAITLLTGSHGPTAGLGRIKRDARGRVAAIVESVDADEATLAIQEVNAGYYCMNAAAAWRALAGLRPFDGGELYLTDTIAAAVAGGAVVESVPASEPSELLGVNDRIELASAEAVFRDRIRRRWMRDGVTLIDPDTTYIGADVVIGQDTVIRPNTELAGATVIGIDAVIGPGTVLEDTVVGDRAEIISTHAESARIGDGASVGPFSHLRPGSIIGASAHIGNHTEIKNAVIGPGAKVGHFSYVGDATVGAEVNIGAGTVTCNYDGEDKHHTYIGEGAFIGSGTMLVAPVSVGPGASTGAGAVVTHDVAPGVRVAGVPARPMPDRKSNPGLRPGRSKKAGVLDDNDE